MSEVAPERESKCREAHPLFAEDKSTLWGWLGQVEARLAKLRLTIHPGAHPRPVSEGFPFLGFLITPARRRLKRHKGVHFQRKFQRLLREYAAGRLPLQHLTDCACGWANHVRYGNTVGLRKSILGRNVLSVA